MDTIYTDDTHMAGISIKPDVDSVSLAINYQDEGRSLLLSFDKVRDVIAALQALLPIT